MELRNVIAHLTLHPMPLFSPAPVQLLPLVLEQPLDLGQLLLLLTAVPALDLGGGCMLPRGIRTARFGDSGIGYRSGSGLV